MADAPPTNPRDVLSTLELKLRRLETELRTGTEDAPAPQPTPAPEPPAPQPASAPEPPAAAEPAAAAARAEVVVEAAPFTELAALEAFRQAVAAAPGAREVYLRSFDAGRAVLEVRLGGPDGA